MEKDLMINPRGYWEFEGGHSVDIGLANALVSFFNKKKAEVVIDIGAGNGYYTEVLIKNGIYCLAYDGNPHSERLTNGLVRVADFSIPQDLGVFDWVLSLEVGEHIPEEYEDIFIDNLHTHNKEGMVISWSIPEYGGEGHFNPRPNEYIINKITKLGYTLDELNTKKLRNSPAKYPEPCYWFSKTIMVFNKDK